MNFDIIPAIDLRDGNVVRLRQGDYSQQTSYRVDPLRLAQDYATSGASWLHVRRPRRARVPAVSRISG